MAPHAEGAHVETMATKSKVVHKSITHAKKFSTMALGADTSMQTHVEHTCVSELKASDGFKGAQSGSSGSKVVEGVGLSLLWQNEGIRGDGVRVREGECRNGDHIVFDREIKVVPPLEKVSRKGMASGTSLMGSRFPSREGGRWKTKAREKMVVDERVAGLVLYGKRVGPFVADPEDQDIWVPHPTTFRILSRPVLGEGLLLLKNVHKVSAAWAAFSATNETSFLDFLVATREVLL
ncbi:hypothetical protein ACOSP7_006972 [Xanthoceras sorbifolium]